VVRAPGRTTFARDVLALPGSTTRIHAALADARGILEQPWFWVGAGLVAAGLIAGGVLVFSTTEPAFAGVLGRADALTARPR
jgi:hypothetical protein